MSYLIYVVEVGFHALDSDVLVSFGGLRFQYFRKRSLALLADESILCFKHMLVYSLEWPLLPPTRVICARIA